MMKKTMRLKEELKTLSPCSIIMSHKILSWRVSCAMIERRGMEVGGVGSTIGGRITGVSARGTRMGSNQVLNPRAEEARENIESIGDVIHCW